MADRHSTAEETTANPDPWRIPTIHDPASLDSVARWEVLRKAGRFEWDAERGASWQRVPALAQYRPLVDALIASGLDSDAEHRPEHDSTLNRLRERAAAWALDDAAAAFVSGLWSAPAAWRSALPGVLIARSMPEHSFAAWSATSQDLCEVCGFRVRAVQVMSEWAFRLTAGTPLDGDPVGYADTLRWLGSGRPEPSDYDRWALGAIRAVLRGLPDGARYSAAAKALSSAKILRGRQTATSVLEDLALSGVLAPPEHPGMHERFTTYRERDQRPDVRVEVQAPLAWWDTSIGDHGVNTDVFEALFGALDIPVVSLDAPRPPQLPTARHTIDGGIAARARAFAPPQPKTAGSVGDGDAAAGDVWAIRLEPGRWVTAYVHEVRLRERAYARTEFLVGVFQDMPSAEEASNLVQPRSSGRAPTWAHSLEKTPWVRRIAQGATAPESGESLPDGGSWVHAKELRNLSAWHFEE